MSTDDRSEDRNPSAQPSGPPPSAPPRDAWGGEYDADATAFIQLPPSGQPGHPDYDAGADAGYPEQTPLAAPGTGQGWEPPVIPPPTPVAGTDPAATGQWTLPFAPAPAEPDAEYGTAYGTEPERTAFPATGQAAAAALAGSHEGRLQADTAPAEPFGSQPPEPDALPGPDPLPGPDALPAPGPLPAPDGPAPGDAAPKDAEPAGTGPAAVGPEPVPVAPAPVPETEHPLTSYPLHVNGAERHVHDVWIGESLLYVLRERLGLAGAKDGCSQGECGACSVQVDGRLVASCLVPAATAAGSEIRTVEGLAEQGTPSDVQRALARHSRVQCGFCVPGMAMTAHDLLEGNHDPTELEIRTALCGNLCRCSGYRGVIDAVREVAAERAARPGRTDVPGAGDGNGSGTPPAGTPPAGTPAGGGTDGVGTRIPHQAGPADEGGAQ
ncbi:(2Fe-2S)-binding protein [Streptomyces sp. TRM 70351]|uniref:(2Fe-2S)-binding protein n=1 Tax=Streptomyces sp. TRM 70351 TaxID=3116552 RepID=UPI002E7B49FA|nr:(2Fe-2S)-binding protein [Streptomyces sp. TRM 70351]MEE1928108.1 (2Fe-2S)-binding protein [Streptomyces sp. TRM 70351]